MKQSHSSNCYINSKHCEENDLHHEARNTTSNCLYGCQWRHPHPKNHSQTRMENAHMRLRSCQCSIPLQHRKENTYANSLPSIKHTSALYIHVPCSLISWLLKATENESKASTPFTVSKVKSALPLLVSSSPTVDGCIGAWVTAIGYNGIDGNIRGNTLPQIPIWLCVHY
jgi:hypothetical protein